MKYLLTLLLIALIWTGHDVIVENERHKEHCQNIRARYIEAEQYQVMVKTGEVLSDEGEYMIIRVKAIEDNEK